MNLLKCCAVSALMLATAFFLPASALADAVSGPIANVAYDQQNPHTIYLIDQGSDTGGLWLTVWEDWRKKATTGADIYGQFINGDGTFCGSEFIISNSSGNQTVPRASYRQDVTNPTKSKVVVVWQDTRPDYIFFNALSNINAAADCSFDSGTEQSIGFNPVRVYSEATQTVTPVLDEVIGNADPCSGTCTGGPTVSAVLNNIPVVPGSVVIKVDGVVSASDDGQGKLVGTVKGAISYSYGAISVVFEAFPATTVSVTASYDYKNRTIDVTDEFIGYGTGTDTDFRATLSIAPVVAGTGFTSINIGGVPSGIHDNGLGRFVPTITETAEPLATGDGIAKTFTKILAHHPVEKGTVVIKVGGVSKCSDSGLKSGCTVSVNYDTGFITALFTAAPANLASVTVDYKRYAGTISYESGVISLTLAVAPDSGDEISVDYTYRAVPPAKVSLDDSLLARMQPRIAYDRTADRFWVVWKETRSILHRLSEICFADTNPSVFGVAFDDSDFVGYVRLSGDTLYQQNSELEVAGADINRNADTTTVREISHTFSDSVTEVREHESFKFVSNPDVACDDTSTQCLIVSEGLRSKLTLTCKCNDKNGNGVCDLGEVVSATINPDVYDDGFVHIYGLSDNYMTLPVVQSMKLDSAADSNSNYPAVAFDSISKRFLVVWEDMRNTDRDGSTKLGSPAKKKIWGQLIYSGGGLYNINYMISFEDTDGNGKLDTNVAVSDQSKPFISYDGVNQRFFVVWQDGRNGSLSTENLDLYGQKVDSEGSLRGENFAILTQPGNQYNPTLAYNELTDTYLATWKDARNFAKKTCSATSSSGGSLPCGSDVYANLFTLGQPSITLLNLDNTPLTPPLLNCFENPASSPACSLPIVNVGLFSTQSFKIRNTGDTILKIDYIDQNLSCNGIAASISPFTFDGLPSQLTAKDDGNTLDLVPGAELPLTVRFTPSIGGSYNKCFVIVTDGGSPTVNLSALANEPDITILPTSGVFGGVYIGNHLDQTFVVRNSGLANLIISTVDAPATPFTIQSDNCTGASVTPGTTCNIVVRFTPSTLGATAPASFGINSNDPDTPTLTVSLSGTGLGSPAITVSPASIAFGDVQVNQTSQKTITITNAGTSGLELTSFSSLSAPFSYLSNTCPVPPATLSVGGNCLVVVKFSPTLSGSTSSSITIVSNDLAPGKSPLSISLSGSGITTPVLNVNPSSAIFLDVLSGTTAQQDILVSNAGTADLIITSFTDPSAAEFSIISTGCLGTFHPKSGGICVIAPCECTVTIAFKPTSGGFKQSSFSLVSNDPVHPTTTVPLSGTVKVAPVISVSPTAAAFGNVTVGGSSTISITVSNTGTANLVIASANGIAAPFSKTGDTCTGSTLAPLTQICTITLKFSPTSTGVNAGNLVITSNDTTNGGLRNIPLSGTGIPTPVAGVSTTSLAFGNVVVGTVSNPQAVTFKNNGPAGSILRITSVTYPSLPFRITGDTCTGASLASGVSCTVSISFAPITTATYSPYYLTVNTNDPAAAVTKIMLSGTGAKKPTISVSPTSLAFGNRTINTTSSKKTITVKNTASSSTLSISTVTIPAPFSATRNTCTGANLAYNQTCVIDVVFRPTARVSYSTNLTINSNDSSRPAATVALTGKGI